MSHNNKTQEFPPLRNFFWPIHSHELRKIVPMLIIAFLVCFNYSILRNMKDAVVVTASGAQVIPFIKVWALLPMAILLTYTFTKLTNYYSQEKVIYIMISGFLAFYALYIFVLFPLRDILHPHALADSLEKSLPSGFTGLISMFRYWIFTCFYVMVELWGTIVLSVIFWGFVNEITKLTEARRFYAVLSIVANIAAVIAGQLANYFSYSEYISSASVKVDNWEEIQFALILVIIVSGIFTMATFFWMNRTVLTDSSFDALHLSKKEMRVKKKASMRDSFSFLSNSKYLIYIAVLVISYNLVINLVEVLWKDNLRTLYSSTKDFNTYMNNLTSLAGVFSTIIAFFLAGIIKRVGWTKTALITPIIMFVTSVGFFFFLFTQNYIADFTMLLFGTTPLVIVVFFGGLQNCLSKATKYSVFDVTKEMAFIPLPHDVKLKGKAAIDGVLSRLGKSAGSLIHQILLMIFGALSLCAPYVAVIILGATTYWIYSTKKLGKLFNQLVQKQQADEDSIFATENVQIEPKTSKATG